MREEHPDQLREILDVWSNDNNRTAYKSIDKESFSIYHLLPWHRPWTEKELQEVKTLLPKEPWNQSEREKAFKLYFVAFDGSFPSPDVQERVLTIARNRIEFMNAGYLGLWIAFPVNQFLKMKTMIRRYPFSLMLPALWTLGMTNGYSTNRKNNQQFGIKDKFTAFEASSILEDENRRKPDTILTANDLSFWSTAGWHSILDTPSGKRNHAYAMRKNNFRESYEKNPMLGMKAAQIAQMRDPLAFGISQLLPIYITQSFLPLYLKTGLGMIVPAATIGLLCKWRYDLQKEKGYRDTFMAMHANKIMHDVETKGYKPHFWSRAGWSVFWEAIIWDYFIHP